MDEMGSDTNKGRNKKIGHVDSSHDGFRRTMEITDADNNPFHVTNCMTTRSDGATPIPPFIGHSNPASKSSSGKAKISSRHVLARARGGCEHSRPCKLGWRVCSQTLLVHTGIWKASVCVLRRTMVKLHGSTLQASECS